MKANSKLQVIIMIREVNPHATLQVIGDAVGLSRERVRQILKRNNLPTCRPNYGYSATCPQCGNRKGSSGKLCRACYSANCYTLIPCDNCDKLLERRKKLIAYMLTKRGHKHQFCNHKCQAIHLIKEHGFGRKVA